MKNATTEEWMLLRMGHPIEEHGHVQTDARIVTVLPYPTTQSIDQLFVSTKKVVLREGVKRRLGDLMD